MNPKMFFKILFMIISLPFTLLQLLTHNVRLSIPKRVAGLLSWAGGQIFHLAKWVATKGIPGVVAAAVMFLVVLILYGLSVVSLGYITFYFSKLKNNTQ